MTEKRPVRTLLGGLAVARLVTARSGWARSTDAELNLQPVSGTGGVARSTTSPAPRSGTLIRGADGPVTYAGVAYDRTAYIAITVTDDEAVAYICDGYGAGLWLRGTATGGQLTLIGSRDRDGDHDGGPPGPHAATVPGGPHLIGTVAEGVAGGTITAGPRRWPFGIRMVRPPSGLYRTEATVGDTPVVGTWIVLPDGAQAGVLDNGGLTGPAPRLELPSGITTVDGTVVRAARLDGVPM